MPDQTIEQLAADLAAERKKVAEFRTTNVDLMKELDHLRLAVGQYEGLHPDKIRADLAELETLRQQAPADSAARIADLEARLAAAESVAANTTLHSVVADAFSRAGGRPQALEFIVQKATEAFTVEGGTLTGKTFSPERPGERLSLHEFMTRAVKDLAFAFGPSSGGGASRGAGGGASGVREVLDPTPAQLGQLASDIKAGTVRVRYTR